jgi:NADPH-dependent 2,4-dienoyl-CoA reductase/sulfur reductase-like enzyme/rhodanese-related sulfurtransferase
MKIVIIGGVAGGASAAARARRLDENAEILLIQSGPDVSFASCGMPYFIGGEITDRNQMSVQTPASLKARLNIDVRVNHRLTNVDAAAKIVTITNEKTGETFTSNYDHLVLAIGAEPFKPPIKGIERPGLFSLRNLDDMDNIVNWIEYLKKTTETQLHCVVAGAGFVGLEMVEQLMNRGMKVSIVEMQDQVLGPLDFEMAAIIQKSLEKHGVNVVVGDSISEFLPVEGDPNSTVLKLSSGNLLEPAQMTILGLGVRPDTKVLCNSGIECTPRGHIVVNESLQTSIPNIWAVGDTIEVRNPILGGSEMWSVPLAGPANRQGRMAADNIYGKNRKYKGTYGASVVRVFELIAACVGINEKMLKAKGIPHAAIHVHPGSHAGYFPGAKAINFKIIFNPVDGTIFGAQAVGEDGVEKRIDVISTAMQGNLKVDDLADLELCYAPPVGAAKDPVNMAGMAAQNLIDGLVKIVDWKDLDDEIKDENVVVLDVRNPGEVENMGQLVPGAVNIPLNDLRSRIHELPKNKKYIVSCAVGQRGYYGCRILLQSGFEHVYNLSGAFKTYDSVRSMK